MALEYIFGEKRGCSKSIRKRNEKPYFAPPERPQNEPRCLQDGLRTALGPLLAALGLLLVALGPLLAALGSILVRLETLLAPLGSLLVALGPLWVRSRGGVLKSTGIDPNLVKAPLLSIGPNMGLVLLYLSIDPVLVALIPSRSDPEIYCFSLALELLVAYLGASWATFCLSWAALGHFWAAPGRSWAADGCSWAAPGRLLAALGTLLAALGPLLAILGRS